MISDYESYDALGLAWGPPEEQVRAVLTVARDVNHKRHLDAFAWLKTWGDEWNRAQASPEAPERNANPAAYVLAWEEWCKKWGYKAGNVEMLGRDLHAMLPNLQTKQRWLKGKKIRYYLGIGQ